MQTVYEVAQNYGFKILGALAIFIVGRIVIGFVVKGVRKLMKRSSMDETLQKFLLSLIRMGLLAFLIIFVVDQLGVETASFAAVIAAAGLAVGFALQGSLSNFASGVMLITFRPFKAGDFVEAGGVSGVVEAIQIFITKMRTPDNKEVLVPNSQVMGGTITNYSAKETRRVDMVFGIGYGDDIKKARDTMQKILDNHPKVLKDPAPQIAVSELADSSVNFVVRPWAKTEDYWGVYFDIHEQIKLTFDEEGISIPFPQQDVHMHQVTTA